MEKFPSLGNCSSAARPNRAAGLLRLQRTAQLPFVRHVLSVLGPEAQLHLVGGAVREAFFSDEVHDLDLAVRFTPERTGELLQQAGVRVIETGKRHGTVTAVGEDSHVEITTFRKPGAVRPDDYSSSIEEDLAGRDFTINAIAYSLSDGTLVDSQGGFSDLERSLLRCVGAAEDRFREDPLRMLRLIRFGPASMRSVDEAAVSAVRSLSKNILGVSVERIYEELSRILLSPQAGAGIKTMLELGLIELLLPEMLPSVGFEQNEFHIHDVFDHTLWVIDRCPFDRRLRWAALFHDLGKPASFSVSEDGRRHFYNHEKFSETIALDVMERLRFSNHDSKAIATLVRYHMRPLEVGPAGLRRLLRDLDDQFEPWLEFKRADSPPIMNDEQVQSKFKQFHELLDAEYARRKGPGLPKLAISGTDLIELGMRPGPALGGVLKQLEEMIIENPDVNTREILLIEAKRLIEASS